MLNYPFSDDSFADEFLLPKDVDRILENNQGATEYLKIAKPFVVGSDGGEETYFIDLASDVSRVFTFDLEIGRYEQTASDWKEYLAQIRSELKEIEDDKSAEQKRKLNKKWWEFWK